jgi:hypothetical protein
MCDFFYRASSSRSRGACWGPRFHPGLHSVAPQGGLPQGTHPSERVGHPKRQDKQRKAPGPREPSSKCVRFRAGRGRPGLQTRPEKPQVSRQKTAGRPELQEPTFRAERERWGTRKSQKLQIPGDTLVPPGRRRYEEGKSRTHPSERVGHPKNQHKKHKAFLCAKSAVTLLTRESS